MTCVRIKSERVNCEEIKPGELFSIYGPEWWDKFGDERGGAIGESVYVRTHYPTPPNDVGQPIYRITVEAPDLCPRCSKGVSDCATEGCDTIVPHKCKSLREAEERGCEMCLTQMPWGEGRVDDPQYGSES